MIRGPAILRGRKSREVLENIASGNLNQNVIRTDLAAFSVDSGIKGPIFIEYVSSLIFTTHLLTCPSSTELLAVVNAPSPLCFPMKLRVMTTPFEAVRILLIHSRNKGVSELTR